MFKNRWKRIGILLGLAVLGMGWRSAAAFAAEAPNDPLYGRQAYLQQIHIPEAWEWIRGRALQPVTVAVVDTGVDLDHADLKDRLIEGTNIINPKEPPQDDFGHGTGVAGVIAAVSNNGLGIAGIAPNVKIMPVKAVGSDGNGDEEHLGEGIRYAVDHGADMIVLSLGLNLYSTYMSEIIEYAESKGVLLVAATGNKGQPVMYPAAYKKVVAVGGANVTSEYKTSSNFGPEVDLIAPWYVYTTAHDGTYTYKEGTSMAAPQVAAVAALMLGLDPGLTPEEIRNRLRQSAKPVGTAWNPYAGYGLLQADLALTVRPLADMYEPNNAKANARPISVIGTVHGEISAKEDIDWYSMKSSYPGTIRISAFGAEGGKTPLELRVDRGAGKPLDRYDLSGGETVTVASSGGTVYVSLQLLQSQGTGRAVKYGYRLETDFNIYKDSYEPNDKAYQAYTLPAPDGRLTGTFHQLNDHDWFAIRVTVPGTLQLRAETDTPRIDPELYITSESGGVDMVIDDGIEGETEFSSPIAVQPGTHYVRVRNARSLYPLPVSGEYRLDVKFERRFIDAYEPNNRSFQATSMAVDRTYKGVFHSSKDEDWFQFRVDRRSLVTVRITNIPKDRYIYYRLFNADSKQKFSKTSPFGSAEMVLQHELEPGVYYVRLMADVQFQDREYGLRLTQAEIVSGFADISGHWARDSIARLVEMNIVKGYGNFRFEPNRALTRAEATALLVRAFNLTSSSAPSASFRDVPGSHWAKQMIGAAADHGVVQGYPDGLFRPAEPITRAEMAVMTALAAEISLEKSLRSFPDVPPTHWAEAYINAFLNGGYLQGFEDGTFRPNANATRAQFATLLSKIIQ